MRIVIVEDEAPIRQGLGKTVVKINPEYELAGMASDGIEGLKLIRKEQPDLVIMDIEMPDMDGLTMLKILRSEGNACKVIVLSAYADFAYAKAAIELGIENYILKPVKLPELKRTMEAVDAYLKKENIKKSQLKLENILTAAITGQDIMKDQVSGHLLSGYAFDIYEPLGLFLVWLGEYYKDYAEVVKSALKNIGQSSRLFQVCILYSEERKRIVAVLYHLEDREKIHQYLKKTIVPMVSSQTNRKAVMGLRYCEGMEQMQQTCSELQGALDYNLSTQNSLFVYYEQVIQIEWKPFKYPLEIENRSRQAVVGMDDAEFKSCFKSFIALCEDGQYHPKEVKEACLKYCYSMLNTAKECGRLKGEEFPAQTLLQSVMKAVTWEQMLEVMEPFFAGILAEDEQDESSTENLLVRKARNLIQEYYNQGITLEEIARKLCVSEEYLSALFRKETGTTFTETIRKFRVEKVKELLLSTSMKLNQIAVMTGYADPKYMSKVFREETGMLPLEYRKMNI